MITHVRACFCESTTFPQGLQGGNLPYLVWKLSLKSFTDWHLKLNKSVTILLSNLWQACGFLIPEQLKSFTFMWFSFLNCNYLKNYFHTSDLTSFLKVTLSVFMILSSFIQMLTCLKSSPTLQYQSPFMGFSFIAKLTFLMTSS